MYKAPFYLTGNRGNNAFSYELRKDPKLYILLWFPRTLDDAELEMKSFLKTLMMVFLNHAQV